MSFAQPAPAPGSFDESSFRYAGWRVVFACFVITMFLVGFGLYGHGVYLAELQRLHGWPAGVISGASTLSFLLSNALVLFTDTLVARLGLKGLVLAGLATFAASLVLLATATEPWQLYPAFILMSAGWLGMGTVVIATIVSQWFVRRRGLAISLAFNGASFGGVAITPALVLLVERNGFTAAMLIATAIMLAMLLPLIMLFIGSRPVGAKAPEAGADPQTPALAPAEPELTRAGMVRDRAFWTISVTFALTWMAQIAFIVHLIAMLEPKVGRANAGFAVFLMTLMSMTGRFGLGMFVDRLDPRWVTAVGLASQAAAAFTILQSDNVTAVLAASAIFGLSIGNNITLPALIIHREFSAASFAAVMGLSTAISGTIGALGPVVIGLVRGWSGDYQAALALCIGLQLAAAATVLQRRRPAKFR